MTPKAHRCACTIPGFGIDATIESDLPTMYKVWLGRMPLRAALKEGLVEFSGTAAVVRRLPAALELSPIAGAVAATT